VLPLCFWKNGFWEKIILIAFHFRVKIEGAFVSALKKIDFELKECRDIFFRDFLKKKLKIFLFVYYHENHFFFFRIATLAFRKNRF